MSENSGRHKNKDHFTVIHIDFQHFQRSPLFCNFMKKERSLQTNRQHHVLNIINVFPR